MKLSNNTIKILKNYSDINQSMVFTQGNKLRTLSNAGNIFSISTIDEEIPVNVSIYDLSSMLAMLSCLDSPEIEFKKDNLEIFSDKGSFEVYFCDPSLIEAPPESTLDVYPKYEFDLTSSDLQLITKAAAVTKSPALTIKCDGSKVTLKTSDRKNETSSSYKKVIGEYSEKFDVYISVENLKIIDDTYKVTVSVTESEAILLHFRSTTKDTQYWIACEIGSKI